MILKSSFAQGKLWIFLQIRHLSEAAVFSVYGHWVNRGYYYSRDLLFANRPRPRYQNPEVQMVAA